MEVIGQDMGMTNPTGGRIRNDGVGEGYWHAPRGSRVHLGIDLLLPEGVGQQVIAPHSGVIVRNSFPYQGDERFSGVLLEGASAESRLWYLESLLGIIGKFVKQGQVIGHAQDISIKYGKGCRPHVHWQIGKYGEIDPLILI